MYESYWDKEKNQPRSKYVMAFGYVDDLVSDKIPDPVAYYKEYVKKENEKRSASVAEETRPRAFAAQMEKNIWHFLVHSLLTELGVKETIDILASQKRFQFSVYIELFNHCYEQHYSRDFRNVFFDCANYYFKIGLPKEDKQKGPSKENRHEPIIGQALLLDADLVPRAMQMYPGNESEKPYIRKVIEEMKQRYRVSGKTVQVADKGLNCARNIYAAVIEANDGYIFSKSIHGKALSQTEKNWILLENDTNVFVDYPDESGGTLFRLKPCVDTFSYSFKETDPETGEETVTSFSVKEKRVVSYNPGLAKKQRAEILKMADKAARCTTYKRLQREELGDCAKYVKVTSKDKDRRTIRPQVEINQAKIDEDLKFAGYNLLVTSELEMDPLQVYSTYHSLWKIEESFRITKSYLDARPVYVQKKKQSMGIF